MVMSIREVIDYCKSERLYTALIIVVVGLGSFGLGRLSVVTSLKVPITIVADQSTSSGGLFLIGSRKSKKYYLPWCGSAAKIDAENRVTFVSTEEARVAGYTPAENCKGLH